MIPSLGNYKKLYFRYCEIEDAQRIAGSKLTDMSITFLHLIEDQKFKKAKKMYKEMKKLVKEANLT